MSKSISTYIPYSALIECGVAEFTIKQGLSNSRKGRDTWVHDRLIGSKLGKVMIQVESIPEKSRAKIGENATLYSKVGGTYIAIEKATSSPISDTATSPMPEIVDIYTLLKTYRDSEDVRFFIAKAVRVSDIETLATCAAALRLLNAVHSKTEVIALNCGCNTKSELENKIISSVPEVGVSNVRVLQRKAQKWREEGNKSLLPSRRGNDNAKVLTADAEALIISLYTGFDGIKRRISGVHREYMDVALGLREMYDEVTGEVLGNDIPVVSYETCKHVLGKPYIKEAYARVRHGKKYANDFLRFWVHCAPITYSLSLSSSDGWYLPFNKMVNGQIQSKLRAKFVSYPIFDAKTGAILGGAVGQVEDTNLMKAAYTNMVENCMKYLGGAIPIENQLDNFGQSFKDTLEKLFHHVSFCEPNRPQSKIAENMIAKLEDMVCRYMPGWTGGNAGGITPDFQVNPDNANVGYTSGTELFQHIMDTWNTMKMPSGRTRWQEMAANINPDCTRLTTMDAAHIIGNETIVTVSNSGQFISQYNNEEIAYYIPAWSDVVKMWRRDYRVRVKFCPWDRSVVWCYLFNQEHDPSEDQFICEAKAIPLSSKAKAEMTADTFEALQEQSSHRKRTDEAREKREAAIRRIAITAKTDDDEEDELPIAERMEVQRTVDSGSDKYNKNFKNRSL